MPPGNWPAWAIGPFERYGENPILSPQGTGWERSTLSIPACFSITTNFGCFIARKAMKGAAGIKPDRISREGYAESTDGVTFIGNPDPIIDATEPFETNYGCEDARSL